MTLKTSCPKPKKPLPSPRKPVKRVNAARKRRNWKRAYGSPEYVKWIHEQPCIACGVVGVSVTAHVRTGGTSRKDDAGRTVPLCDIHFEPRGRTSILTAGHHNFLHAVGRECFEQTFRIDLDACAAATQKSWLASLPEEQQKT